MYIITGNSQVTIDCVKDATIDAIVFGLNICFVY